MSKYIIVLPVGVLDSATRAKQITRELYNITVPLAVQADYQDRKSTRLNSSH